MGQAELLNFLKQEAEVDPRKYWTSKEIRKALNNIGTIMKKETCNVKLKQLSKYGLIEKKVENDFHRLYRYNKEECES